MALKGTVLARVAASFLLLGLASCSLPRVDCPTQVAGASNFAALSCHAGRGDRSAQITLARAYETGVGLARDMKKAVHWYKRAATANPGTMPVYIPAVGQQKYGTVLTVDTGPAHPGDAWAQFRLGEIYLAGEGVRQSDRRARKWLRRSAEQGYRPAAELLASLEAGGKDGDTGLEKRF
jgi:hypothetical protein